MSNLDVALAGFWQLARHWKNGEKAKIELSCDAGSLHMQLSAVLGHPDQPHFPHPPPPPPTSSLKRKSPSQLRRQERRRDGAASRDKEAAAEVVDETAKVQSANNTKGYINSTEDLEDSEKNLSDNHEEDHSPVDEAIPTKVSFQCDQCKFCGISEKGLKQHTRMKHKVNQVDGNSTESEDEDIIHDKFDNEPIIKVNFDAFGRSNKCISCGESFASREECYKHMFLSMSQCCETTVSNLIACGFEKEIREDGIQKTMMKVQSLLPKLK